jgi:hypothetical protein
MSMTMATTITDTLSLAFERSAAVDPGVAVAVSAMYVLWLAADLINILPG